jgi:hypothetical protein
VWDTAKLIGGVAANMAKSVIGQDAANQSVVNNKPLIKGKNGYLGGN